MCIPADDDGPVAIRSGFHPFIGGCRAEAENEPRRTTVTQFYRERDGLTLRSKYRTLSIQAAARDAIRIREVPAGTLTGRDNALLDWSPAPAEITIGEHGASLKSGAIRVDVSPSGRLEFFGNGSEPLLSDVDWNPEFPQLHPNAREFHAVTNDLYRIEARFEARDGERFFGLGQHRHGLLDQKGAVIDLFQRNAEVCIPFLVSSRGYGFLWNNPGVGRVELGTAETRWVADGAREVDYVVISPQDEANPFPSIMTRYAELTGFSPAMPEWASGFWQCKLRYSSQEELLGVAREYKRRGLPLSVIVVDFFHWRQQGDWSFDPEKWPDPQGMANELEAMGVKLMVSIWPTVNLKSHTFRRMLERGFLLRASRGEVVRLPFIDTYEESPALVGYLDPTNPAAREFVWQKCKKNYWDKGVSLFWLDACEPELYPIEHDNVLFHEGEGREVANLYPLMQERAFYEGMREAGAPSVINLCRSAWAGSQRYGAAVWSGDIASNWETLKKQISAGLNMALSGIPWWTTDIGGFAGGDITDPDFHELIVRWFQFGVFCPIFRLHGNRSPRESDHKQSGADNEAWSFGDRAYAIIRELLFLRERLRPYVHRQMEIASRTGVPPMRPLFFDYPADEYAYTVVDQFLFGADLLVAPVVDKGAVERSVYIPKGAQWKNAWTGELCPSGESVPVKAPLDAIPVFVREGADVTIAKPQTSHGGSYE
jgi:alpha-D-xyloside xylohydrolase